MIDKDIIKERIRFCVQKNSGGMKFTELVVDVYSASRDMFDDVPSMEIAVLIENIIREMSPEIEVLEYQWRMTDNEGRLKMFVYTPS